MRRVFGMGRTGTALGLGAVLAAVVAGTTLMAPGRASTAAGEVGRAAARQALTRLIHQERLGPGIPVPGTTTELPGPAGATGGTTQVSYYNWSGFADIGRTYNKVAAAWAQPAIRCLPNEDEIAVFWVGLDGYSTSTVEQDGTLAQCIRGQAAYYTWWEMYPTNDVQLVGGTVKPGDHITASVDVVGGRYNLAVTDTTTPANSFTRTETCATSLTCSRTSAEWIAETPGTTRGLAPWPSFTTWKVTNATVASSTGVHGVIKTFPNSRITIIGQRSESLANTGALDAAGNGFNVAWKYAW